MRHAFTANCSSLGLVSLNQPSPSTWSNDANLQVRDGGPFLRNHAPDIAAMDLFVVPTIGFDLLYAFVIARIDRRELVWINVTTNPTAEWIARQLTEAFPWDEAPRYLICDRDPRDASEQLCQASRSAAHRKCLEPTDRDQKISSGRRR